jgi:hypothetical protein
MREGSVMADPIEESMTQIYESLALTRAYLAQVEATLQDLRLRRVECGAIPWNGSIAQGFRAYLTEGEPPEIAMYCRACAIEEFGDA